MSGETPKKQSYCCRLMDNSFRCLCLACAVVTVVLLAGFFIQLLWHSIPAFKEFGLGFVFSSEWDPARGVFGAWPAIYGTLVTTALAMLIAVPGAFIIAYCLVEILHPAVSAVLGMALDLLAAVPSIIYGMWGLFVLVPLMQNFVAPFLGETLALAKVPLLGRLFAGPSTGFGLLTAGLVLALMVLPFITAVIRDVFRMVPSVVKESAFGIGSTSWEVASKVTLRYGLPGILGAVFLGLGRAIGETMAVLFIIGNAQVCSPSLFGSGSTISSTLANNFAEADGVFQSALFEMGLILLIIAFGLQIMAQMWLNRVREKSGGGL